MADTAYTPPQALPGTTALKLLNVPIATSGSAADRGSLEVPSWITRYAIMNVWAFSVSAAGTLAAGIADLRSAAAGGGASLLTAPVALTGLTAGNLAQSLAVVALGVTYTARTLYLRQTVDSLNAGVVNVYVELLVLE